MLKSIETFHLWENQFKIYQIVGTYRIAGTGDRGYFLHRKSFSDPEACILWAWLELSDRREDPFPEAEWLPLCNDITRGELYRRWLILPHATDGYRWNAYHLPTHLQLTTTGRSHLHRQIDRLAALKTASRKSLSGVGA
ncbi:hypothetical protein [Lyngbya sp. CCY1209]|uniref:hypothetical protein n=1 Tax=Lyngbya sp. CCY1209 TaxID=2886103 RepID=UPI002D201666|nr:hypothetical protein [Lyngbya sp. CCY1209]MEB3884369.1 hypothetical protein [Lyngbya sp. CCY1209]